jgi:hypothetical protein
LYLKVKKLVGSVFASLLQSEIFNSKGKFVTSVAEKCLTIPLEAIGENMQNWKRAVIAGSVGGATILLLKGKRPAAVLVGGVGLAVLASEYPEKFTRIREELPSYVRQGTRFLDLAMKIGSKITELAQERRQSMLEELGEY